MGPVDRTHAIREVSEHGLRGFELRSPILVTARFLVAAGMLGRSLQWQGAEYLGQRSGLAAYLERGATMGIPLLHPFANRLASRRIAVAGRRVELPGSHPLIHEDGQGLPIHGFVAGLDRFEVERASADRDEARLETRLVWQAPDLLELFPFAHTLRVRVALRDRVLRITTELEAHGERVPIAFGWHPYLRLPELPRAAWKVELPVRSRRELDGKLLPTPVSTPVDEIRAALGENELDHLFDGLAADPVFALSGGGKRVEVRFEENYPVAVVYAPRNDDVVCFEPMTALTDPFREGAEQDPRPLRFAAPGQSFSATFEIRFCEDS